MYDRKFYNKVSDLECSFEELITFCSNLSQQTEPIENSFENYFSTDCVFDAIEQYRMKVISLEYLACWAMAYNRIVMSEFIFSATREENISLNRILVWQISDLLSGLVSLGRKDATDVENRLNNYEKGFAVFFGIYQTLQNYQGYFSPVAAVDNNEIDDAYFLLVNESEKKFAAFFCETVNHKEQAVEAEQLEQSALEDKVDELLSNGFENLF